MFTFLYWELYYLWQDLFKNSNNRRKIPLRTLTVLRWNSFYTDCFTFLNQNKNGIVLTPYTATSGKNNAQRGRGRDKQKKPEDMYIVFRNFHLIITYNAHSSQKVFYFTMKRLNRFDFCVQQFFLYLFLHEAWCVHQIILDAFRNRYFNFISDKWQYFSTIQ